MRESIPIAGVSSAMAHLVAGRGWSLLYSTSYGIGTQAAIEKDGVILSYASSKGEADYSVTLRLPVHPVIDPELYQPPDLITVLNEVGTDCNEPKEVFLIADRHLPAIKRYLSDPAVWERRVEEATKAMADKYRRWIDGPEITRKVAQSLAGRHPWLTTGRIPLPVDFKTAGSTSRSGLSRFRSTVVFGAMGIGVLAAHYFT